MKRRSLLTGSAVAAFAAPAGIWTTSRSGAAYAQENGVKPATDFTKAANRKVLETLPFSDKKDFELAKRGFIAGLPDGVIKDADGKVVFNHGR